MNTTAIEKFTSLKEMSAAAAARIAGTIQAAVENRGRAAIVLAGGRTPVLTYQLLAANRNIDWERVHLFWGDERWLPPDDPDSNFFMVKQALLDRIKLPATNLHHPDFSSGSPQQAAEQYEEEIRNFFDGEPGSGRPHLFDLTILGMGEDGHTASLFPGDGLLGEKKHFAAAVPQPAGKPPVPRITMTLPALARSGEILFLVSGAEKLHILRDILAAKGSSPYPAAQVRAVTEVCWMVAADPADFEAAGMPLS